MQHASPGSLTSTFSDLDKLLALLEGYEVYDGNNRGAYTPVTISDPEQNEIHTTFYLPVTTPFTRAEALRLAPILHKYAPDLIDAAASVRALRPLVTLLLTAMRDAFHEFSDDHDLYCLISAELEPTQHADETTAAPESATRPAAAARPVTS